MNAKGLIILLVVVTALTGIVLYWYNLQIPREVGSMDVGHQDQQGLGATLYDQAGNPVADKVPETNPIKASVSNPFDTYQNPFEN